MIDAVRLTYSALRDLDQAEGRFLATLVVEGASPKIHLGLDEEGHQHLLVETEHAEAESTGIAALDATTRDLEIDGRAIRYLDVECSSPEFAEVFDHFVTAVLEQSQSNDDELAGVVAGVLARWRSFFAEADGPPSRERLQGAIGELLVLLDIAKRSSKDLLAAWVGPHGGRHDIRRGSCAIEVKTTRAHTSRTVTVHGEDQLLPPEAGTLHLHFVRLEEVAGVGVSLSDLIDELVVLGISRVELFDALLAAGISPAGLAEMGRLTYDVRERATYPVDDGTPRIVPGSFGAGERPPGIVDLTYRVDLDHIAERALDSISYGELVARLGAR